MFNFNLTVSDQTFAEKPKDFTKITFTEKNVSITQLSNMIKDGRLFSAVFDDKQFPINYKVSDHFKHTNVIPIDIDDCDCSMKDFMGSLKFSPSIAYETFSNLKDGKGYRFRLLYVFNEPLNADQYVMLYDAICNANNITADYNDKHQKSPYQKYFGTTNTAKVIPIGMLYPIERFDEYIEKCPDNYYIKEDNSTVLNGVNRTVKAQFTDKEFEDYWKSKTDIDILTDMRRYNTLEVTQIDWKDGELWRDLTNTDYYEIKRRWTMRGHYKRVPTEKLLKNGQQRRKKIYMALIRRRLINAATTLENMCYAALYELYYFVDNTDKDDYITRYQLLQIARSALNADLTRYKTGLKEDKKFKVNKMQAIEEGITVQQAVGRANGERRHNKTVNEFAELAKKYDSTKSVRKNAELLGITKTRAYSLKKWMMQVS